MFEVNERTIWDYFRGPGKEAWTNLGLNFTAMAKAKASALAWGVSNVVLRVDTPALSFVVKQSRKQLRTQIDWFSRLDRVWREVEVLRSLETLSAVGSVPRVLFEDRNNYLFGMEAVEADHQVWKADLLAGNVDVEIAKTLGAWLAQVHRDSTCNDDLATRFADREVFDELRLDPFYRYVAQHDSVVGEALQKLIAETLQRRDCLVLADFSPKNILLTSYGPVVVDFETAHYGDPGFDIGFFLSHLLLKTVRHAGRANEFIKLSEEFCANYFSGLYGQNQFPAWAIDLNRSPNFEAQCVQHLAACMLARVAGKSRVDYLTEAWQIELVQRLCHELLLDAETTLSEAFDRLLALLREHVASGTAVTAS